MIRAAILGLGRWGRSLVNSVQGQSPDIRFVAAHTRTRATAEAFCREKDMRFVDSYAAVLADRATDAVVLPTPHSQHAAQVMQAAAAGKHIFVEKPMTLDLPSACAAAQAAHKAGVMLAVGFCRRFHPSVVEIRTRKADGRLGATVAMVGQHTTSTGAFIAADNWRADPEEAPAGAMTAVGVHLMDHMIEFGGPVRDVHCVTGVHGVGPADDTTTVMFNFDGGATATIFCSVATATNPRRGSRLGAPAAQPGRPLAGGRLRRQGVARRVLVGPEDPGERSRQPVPDPQREAEGQRQGLAAEGELAHLPGHPPDAAAA